jgi:hypothetical protein
MNQCDSSGLFVPGKSAFQLEIKLLYFTGWVGQLYESVSYPSLRDGRS